MPLLELLRIGSKRVFDQNIWAMLTLFIRKIGLEPLNYRLYKVRYCYLRLSLLHLNQEKWPTPLQPRAFHSQARTWPCCLHL